MMDLDSILQKVFPPEHHAQVRKLVFKMFKHHTYRRKFTSKLIKLGRNPANAWEVRRLAALMLENQVLKLHTNDWVEFDHLFIALGLKKALGFDKKMDKDVWRQGYSTRRFTKFATEFHTKLMRNHPLHQTIQGHETTTADLERFVHWSQQECKLTLARYLFSPEEVVDRVLKTVTVSQGVLDRDYKITVHDYRRESQREQDRLPRFEREIFKRLRNQEAIYWVSEQTSSALNALVAYPLGSAVLVVKPPGSHREFELKRAGLRGPRHLSVKFYSNRFMVSQSHRFWGGAMSYDLKREAGRAALFSTIYRAVHQSEAPVSRTLCRTTVKGVPTSTGECDLYDYFNSEEFYGEEDFPRMRDALEHSVPAFVKEREERTRDYPKKSSYTTHFLELTDPAQTILCSSSAFRLDGLVQYLSDEGPELFFQKGLKRSFTPTEAKWFADELLEEILGIYCPPEQMKGSYGEYVAEAFSIPANRERAHRNFRTCMEQIGLFWGTLLGVRGYSRGESFVGRNVGIRSVWEAGAWKTKLIFMDHDDLYLFGEDEVFWPNLGHMYNTMLDETFVLETLPHRPLEGTVPCLAAIYRIPEEEAHMGRFLLNQSMKTAYVKTQEAVKTQPQFHKIFSPAFVKRIGDWDVMVKGRLAAGQDPQQVAKWRKKMTKRYKDQGYKKHLIQKHLDTIDHYIKFFTRFSFLYE